MNNGKNGAGGVNIKRAYAKAIRISEEKFAPIQRRK